MALITIIFITSTSFKKDIEHQNIIIKDYHFDYPLWKPLWCTDFLSDRWKLQTSSVLHLSSFYPHPWSYPLFPTPPPQLASSSARGGPGAYRHARSSPVLKYPPPLQTVSWFSHLLPCILSPIFSWRPKSYLSWSSI